MRSSRSRTPVMYVLHAVKADRNAVFSADAVVVDAA
jgi:hypothetical protein